MVFKMNFSQRLRIFQLGHGSKEWEWELFETYEKGPKSLEAVESDVTGA